MRYLLSGWIAALLMTSPVVRAEPTISIRGTAHFEPAAEESSLPELFRLPAHSFGFTWQKVETYSTTFDISLVTFPSPMKTPYPNNNTVHCEYFRPLAAGKHPAVIVLHILGGDFDLARLFARQLAQNGVAALFLKMPYYGPRRQPDSEMRMISTDVRTTTAGMRQAVLDIRQGAGWLMSRPEVDADRLGIFGISLGGITAALAATAEPRFHNVCTMLAGGDIGQVAWSSRELKSLRARWTAEGGTREQFFDILKTVDPVTYAQQVQGRRILMLNASRDEVIPKRCTESLWQAFGKPEIVWFDAGHYSAMLYVFDGLARVTKFFQS